MYRDINTSYAQTEPNLILKYRTCFIVNVGLLGTEFWFLWQNGIQVQQLMNMIKDI